MRNWRVLIHNPVINQSLVPKIEALGAKVLPLYRTRLHKRSDRPSFKERTVQLFPGYMLLNFDPQDVHTTAITALSGAHGFVRFGEQPCIVHDEVIATLQRALVRTDGSLECIDYRNLTTDLERSLHTIINMRNESARKAAFCALFQHGAALERLVSESRAMCYTAIDPL
jgi:transcriptional antiterminator RfaH